MTSADHVARLLAAERAEGPPPGVAELGRARLFTSLAAEAAQVTAAASAAKLGWTVVAKWIGAGFAVGIAGAGVAAVGTGSPAEAPLPVASTAQVVQVAPTRAEEAPRAVEGASGSSAVPDSQNIPARPEVAPPPVAAIPSTSTTFDEELRLLTAAKRDLDGGRPHLARVWLLEHRGRFPKGVFSVEREGLLVLAQCGEHARPALAREFATRYPRSPMIGQLLRRCGAQESAGAPPQVDFPEGDK